MSCSNNNSSNPSAAISQPRARKRRYCATPSQSCSAKRRAPAKSRAVNDLTPLPALPATGVPAELVERRPDVRKAFADLMAADRRVGAAIANRYPKLSLTAGVSSSPEYLRDLFDNWLASLAANLVAPLFDGGERKAEGRAHQGRGRGKVE